MFDVDAVVCAFLSASIVYFTYPETKGVPLEEMDAVFGEGASFRSFSFSLWIITHITESIKPGFLEQYSEQVALVGRGSRHSIEDGVDDEDGFAIGDADEEGDGGKQNGWAHSRTQYPPARSNGHAGGYQAVYGEEES